MKFPQVSKELIDALELQFKDQLPAAPVDSLSVINFRAGEIAVIRFLRTQFNNQNKNILET